MFLHVSAKGWTFHGDSRTEKKKEGEQSHVQKSSDLFCVCLFRFRTLFCGHGPPALDNALVQRMLSVAVFASGV